MSLENVDLSNKAIVSRYSLPLVLIVCSVAITWVERWRAECTNLIVTLLAALEMVSKYC